MTKLTQQEMEKEIGLFNQWFLKSLSEGVKSEHNQLVLAWLARAELEKNSKDFVVNNNIKSSRDNKIIEFIASTMTTEQFKGFCFGNAIKYCLRLSSGEDSVKEDIAKVNQFKLIFENKKHLCAD